MVSFSSPIKRGFQYIPETYVNSISKSTPIPSHSGPPVGAHTSGFYSKMRMENQRPATRASATLTSMLSDISNSSKTVKQESVEKEQPVFSNRVSFVEKGKFPQGIVTIIDTYIAEPDINFIEESLAQLTDIDAPTNRSVDALNDLLDAVETDTSIMM
jgi:hypothetical protein